MVDTRARGALTGAICLLACWAAGTAGSAPAHLSATVPVSCTEPVEIGLAAPLSGAASTIGLDQLHWAQFEASRWNATHRAQISIVHGDTQLSAASAGAVAQSFSLNPSIVGVIGPASSAEVGKVGSVMKRSGMAFVSSSALGTSLTRGSLRGTFFRVVPSDSMQAPSIAAYATSTLGVGKGTSTFVVDDGSPTYAAPLASELATALTAAGATVTRKSISTKQHDFTALVTEIPTSTKVVFLATEQAAQAQELALHFKAQGRSTIVFATDRSFDARAFKANNSYVSFFAPDLSTIPAARATVAAFRSRFHGETSPFGPPAAAAVDMFAQAIEEACAAADQTVTRDTLRTTLATQSLPKSILGTPLAFDKNGDVAKGTFRVYKIVGGKYVTVK